MVGNPCRNRIKPTIPCSEREYRDEIKLSTIGFGGIVVGGQDQSSANNEVAHSFDKGVTAAIPQGDQTIYRNALAMPSTLNAMTQEEQQNLLAEASELSPLFRA